MKDPILLSLSVLAAKPEKHLDLYITLVVGGFLVSGHIVSYEEYSQQHHITSGIKHAFDIIEKDAGLNKLTESSCDFIHLRNTQFFIPGPHPIPRNMETYARFSIDSVQGFFFGSLSVKASPGS